MLFVTTLGRYARELLTETTNLFVEASYQLAARHPEKSQNMFNKIRELLAAHQHTFLSNLNEILRDTLKFVPATGLTVGPIFIGIKLLKLLQNYIDAFFPVFVFILEHKLLSKVHSLRWKRRLVQLERLLSSAV